MSAHDTPDDTLAPLIVSGGARPRDQRDLMERPFFSLAKSRRVAPIRYQAGQVEVWVQGLPDFGMATIWDADVLIWAGSQIVEAADRGLPTSRRLRFLPYQLLTATGRATGATEYRLLKAALRRLQSTVVATTLRNGEHWRRHQFSWINEWTELAGPGGRSLGLEIVLPDWFYRGVLDRALVLSIDPAYFQLTGGIERWLYRVARKHAGRQPGGWRFEGSLEKRNHWEKTSHALLVGAILHVLYAERDKTLAGVAAFLSDPERPILATLRVMMRTRHLGEAGVHPVVASVARELRDKSDNERSGVLSTAMTFLNLYRDPVVAQVTGQCDWRIADLVEGPRPTTLYLVVPPSDISRTKPLIRLMLNQIGRRLTETLGPVGQRHRLLLMLDEFPALGRLDFFESALAFMAGYGLKSVLIAQSLNQIEKAYGAFNSILDNCHVRISFATNDERTAKRVSDALGVATELRAMRNYAGHRLSPWLGHLMVSRQETARPLLTPGEVMQLSADEEIVMVSGAPPIRARKVRYYQDARLRRRVLPAPKPALRRGPKPGPDDWSGLAVCAAPSPARSAADYRHDDEDDDSGGPRREPGLPEHEDIAAAPTVQDEFAFDDPDLDAGQTARRMALQQRMGAVARQASLDPNDGVEL